MEYMPKTKAEYIEQYATMLIDEIIQSGTIAESKQAMDGTIAFSTWNHSPPKIKYTEVYDYQNKDGNTAMHIACLYGHKALADQLYKYGARADIANNNNITANDIYKWTPKIDGLCREEANCIRHKFETHPKYKIDIKELSQKFGVIHVYKVFHAKDFDGNSLLHHAALHGNHYSYDLMLSHGVDHKVPNKLSFSPNDIKIGAENIKQACIQHIGDCVKKIMTPKTQSLELHKLAKLYGKHNVQKYIVKAQNPKTGDTLLLLALLKENAILAAELESYGADLSMTNNAGISCQKVINNMNTKISKLPSPEVHGLPTKIKNVAEAIKAKPNYDKFLAEAAHQKPTVEPQESDILPQIIAEHIKTTFKTSAEAATYALQLQEQYHQERVILGETTAAKLPWGSSILDDGD